MEEYRVDCSGVAVNTRIVGEGEPLVLFHGWGGQIDSWRPVIEHYALHRKVYAVDLPGFGKSDEPPAPWSADEYAETMAAWFRAMGLTGCDAMGHSHGGRVLIRMASRYPELFGKLVLVDSAGLIPRRKPSYYCKVYSFKAMKAILRCRPAAAILAKMGWNVEEAVKKRSGSADYRDASGIMRSTLVRCVNHNLRDCLPHIRASTLCIWGRDDADTPVWMGEVMSREIPDAGLAVLENAGHFSYLDQFGQFIRITDVFLLGGTK